MHGGKAERQLDHASKAKTSPAESQRAPVAVRHPAMTHASNANERQFDCATSQKSEITRLFYSSPLNLHKGLLHV